MKNFLFLFCCLYFVACNSTEQEIDSTTTMATEYYSEQHRPQYHFSPAEKWMNDPNGMVYYDGEYHLFYQYYPDSTVWGPMHWGHAVSKDLLHWEHLPIALEPDHLGYIFSGSAVVDWKNTSGFGTKEEPPLIAIFTYHDPVKERAGEIDFQYQAIAYSTDKGRTWTKYEGNPVVPNPGIRDFRDPKVIWDEVSEQWVMVFAAWDHVKFYGSSNLKDWTHLSDFGREWGAHGGVWECPDLFPLKVEGSEDVKWVLLLSINPGSYNGGSGTQYFVGDFDGKTFTIDEKFAEALDQTPAIVPAGTIFEDFENGYGEWQVEGEAFGNTPAQGAWPNQQDVSGYTGNALVNSFQNGDQATGKLTSPIFTIESDFINFQIGGGNDKLRSCMNLLVNDEIVRTAAGGNGEKLIWKGWDVSDLKGKKAQLQIVDAHTGGWGHINVDQITFANELAVAAIDNAVWLDYGRDNYAGVTWSDTPNGRRIFIGWMSNWDYAQVVPTQTWRSAMTIARELSLVNTLAGLRLRTQAVKEMESNRGIATDLISRPIIEGEVDITDELEFSPTQMEAILEFEIPEGKLPNFGIKLANSKGEVYRLGFDVAENQFYSDRTESGKMDFSAAFAKAAHYAPRLVDGNRVKMHIFFDLASAELFADDGLVCMTDIFFPTEDFDQLFLYSKEGSVSLKKATFHFMKRSMFINK